MSTSAKPQFRQRVTVPVSGMTCATCEKRVARALKRLPGVARVDVSAARGVATLTGEALPSREIVDAAIRSAGYEPSAPRWFTDDRGIWRTVGASAVVVALLAWGLSAAELTDLASGLTDPSGGGLLLVLTLGLTAGVSTCMAMVGGLVLSFSASHAAKLAASGVSVPSFLTRMRPQVWFNLGRVVGFGVLGALLGALGSSLSLPTRMTAVLILAVAVVMFLLGVRLTGISPRMAAWSPKLPAGLSRVLGIDHAGESSYSDTRTAAVGALTFFLPCGFTQAVQLYALSTASPITAGLIMATFALGTTPGLLALGSVPEIATGERQNTVLRVVGVVVLAFALVNLSGGMRLLGVTGGSSAASAASQTVSDNVTLGNGVQTVHMTQEAAGYSPENTVVYAGIPITWEIDGTFPFSCSASITMPDAGVRVNLQQGINTVSVPALAEGTTRFTCAMGMYSGTFKAVPAPPPEPPKAASETPATAVAPPAPPTAASAPTGAQ